MTVIYISLGFKYKIMAKYSTGSDDNKLDPHSEDASCELCGSSDNLVISKISGTKLITCKSCSNNSITQEENENNKDNKDNKETKNEDKEKSTVPKKGRLNSNPDSTWVEKDRADYGSMEKPYMKPNYSNILKSELKDRDMNPQDLCDEIDTDIQVIEAVLNKNVVKNKIAKPQISKIEDYLDINLQEDL